MYTYIVYNVYNNYKLMWPMPELGLKRIRVEYNKYIIKAGLKKIIE